MSDDRTDKIAEELLGRSMRQKGICLILGGVDTGKTTLAEALAKHSAQNQPVAIVDADIGQSHIGPPATVGWAVINKPDFDLSKLSPGGISFVGDVTPVGHLLQLTAAIAQCVRRASQKAGKIIIDTPGFIDGSAAAALWWNIQRILQPELIISVQCENELGDLINNMENLGSKIEIIRCPAGIRPKSPQTRRRYRQKVFNEYFQDSRLYNIDLTEIIIQSTRNFGRENLISRLTALRDKDGTDLAVGIINDWQKDGEILTVKAPKLDISRVGGLVIGDVSVDLAGE